MNKEKLIIKCPHCKREYLPAEIYYPDQLLGEPSEILRLDNEIISFDGSNMNLEEEYICDGCNKKFKVIAKISFNSEKVEDLFEEEIDF